MFDTYGPYTLPSQDKSGLREFAAEIQAGPFSGLEDGVGIYIVATENKQGRLTPWYVGQTYKGYQHRVKQHIKLRRFQILEDQGALKIFLLARAKGGQPLFPKDPGPDRRDRKYIDFLEMDLIDCCRKVNPGLLNVSEVGFLRSLYVAGYRDEAEDQRNEAAVRLSEMLSHCKAR